MKDQSGYSNQLVFGICLQSLTVTKHEFPKFYMNHSFYNCYPATKVESSIVWTRIVKEFSINLCPENYLCLENLTRFFISIDKFVFISYFGNNSTYKLISLDFINLCNPWNHAIRIMVQKKQNKVVYLKFIVNKAWKEKYIMVIKHSNHTDAKQEVVKEH